MSNGYKEKLKRIALEGRGGGSIIDSLQRIGEGIDKARTRKRNTIQSGIELLPSLAKLIRDEDSLQNYENFSEELIFKTDSLSDTAIYTPFIESFSNNVREDYDMYTSSMEQGAKFIDDPNFITDMKGWDNLENIVPTMTLEDGKTPKYQGNGTFLFLTEQNDKINSILGRIQNSSQGTQFRYNKAGNKYTDQEMIEKLTQYQKRLGVALQTSIGDGIITKDEAEFIILGDLNTYQDSKRRALKRINSHYIKLDKLQQTLISKRDTIVAKDSGFDFSDMIQGLNIDLNTIQTQVEVGDDGQPIEGGEFIDTNISATSKDDIVTQLEDRIATIHGVKESYKKAYTGWEGRPFREKVTVSSEEKEDYMKNVFGDESTQITGIANLDQETADVAKIDKEKKKVTSKIYDQKPSKTDIDEKQYSNKRSDLFPALKRSNGKFVFVDGENLKEWDNKAYHSELKKEVPILNAGYDTYYWDNGRWKHIKGDSPLGTSIMSPSEYKKIISENKDLSKKQREVFLKDMVKGLKWIKKNLLKTGEVPSKGTIIGIK